MADDELAAIRAARLKELQQQSGGVYYVRFYLLTRQRNNAGSGVGEDAAAQKS